MASLDSLNITNSGLININQKVINSRAYSASLITTVGNPTVIEGISSGFSAENYFIHSPLNLEDAEKISINLKGSFFQNSQEQCILELMSSTENALSLTFTNSQINITYGNFPILIVGNLNFTDNQDFSILLTLTNTTFEFVLYYGKKVLQKTGNLEFTLSVSTFNSLIIGNNFANKNKAWNGTINLNEFSILKDNELAYSPSEGISWNFSNILISDGEFILSDSTQIAAGHVYSFPVTEIKKSGSTILLTCQVDEEAYLTIREIGLYIQTSNNKILFGSIANLNINKSKDLIYDLVFTVNTTLNVVNAIGFPAQGGIIVNDPEFIEFKDFTTMEQVNTYVLTNIERIIRMNAGAKGSYENSSIINAQAGIGYNRPQVIYKLQQEIEQKEDCYNTIDTFTKLVNNFRKITQKEINLDNIEVVGSLDIPSNGNISGFTNSDYVTAKTPFYGTEKWNINIAFTSGNNANGIVSSFIEDSEDRPMTLGINNGKCYLNIKGAPSIETNSLNSLYIRNAASSTQDGDVSYYAWIREDSVTYYNFHLNTLPVSTSPIITFPSHNPIAWEYPQLSPEDFSISFRIKFDSLTGTQYICGRTSASSYAPFELLIKNNKLKCNFYEGGTGILISDNLISRYTLKINKYYNVTLSYQNGRYTMSYEMEPFSDEYPESESIFIYSDNQVSFSEGELLIGASYSQNSEFQGDFDFLNFITLTTNTSWKGASLIDLLYTTQPHPTATDDLYDSDYYTINGEHVDSYSTETILNEDNLFSVSNNTKYNLLLSYSEEGTMGTYKIEKITNDDPETSEIVLNKDVLVLNASDRMGIPSITQIGPYINGTVNLLEWEISQGTTSWVFYNLIILNNTELLQFYHIPNLNKNQYAVSDICTLEKKLRFINNKFEGNEDLINFSYSNGLSLCMKVALENATSKVIFYKSDLLEDIYCSLTFFDQTLSFSLMSEYGPITVSKNLSVEEYSSYINEPIMLTVTFTPQYDGWGYLQMYKNNEPITESTYMKLKSIVDPSIFILSNYIKSTENEGRYLQDLVVIKGVISEEDLKYINNLFDTNY